MQADWQMQLRMSVLVNGTTAGITGELQNAGKLSAAGEATSIFLPVDMLGVCQKQPSTIGTPLIGLKNWPSDSCLPCLRQGDSCFIPGEPVSMVLIPLWSLSRGAPVHRMNRQQPPCSLALPTLRAGHMLVVMRAKQT